MSTFPPLTHVALTVRSLSASVPWYQALLDAEPVLDEDTEPNFHHTVFLLGNGTLLGLHQHSQAAPAEAFRSTGSVSTTSASAAPIEASSRSGPAISTSSASSTAASRMRPTARV